VPVENALAFLRTLRREAPPVAVIAGPHAFLREYCLDQLRERLAQEGFEYRSLQIGAGVSMASVLNELAAADLFAPKRLVACRLLRSYRDRGAGADDDEAEDRASGAPAGGEAVLAAAIERPAAGVRIAIVCERDTAPAKLRRAVEQHGTVVNCMRPFDNQLGQYVDLFARNAGLKISPAAVDLLLTRHGSDLNAISNALSRAAILSGDGGTLQPADFGAHGASRVPDLFELSDAIARGGANETIALFIRAIQTGRDPIELLAVEIIPLIRRMLAAAAMLAARKSAPAIAGALGLPPSSGLLTRALEGARNFGLTRLLAAHRRACLLDEHFKMGLIKERENALVGMLLDLMATRQAEADAPV
jgi:DNA polymerase III delta subunit